MPTAAEATSAVSQLKERAAHEGPAHAAHTAMQVPSDKHSLKQNLIYV